MVDLHPGPLICSTNSPLPPNISGHLHKPSEGSGVSPVPLCEAGALFRVRLVGQQDWRGGPVWNGSSCSMQGHHGTVTSVVAAGGERCWGLPGVGLLPLLHARQLRPGRGAAEALAPGVCGGRAGIRAGCRRNQPGKLLAAPGPLLCCCCFS
jgi:hypothetical protein